MKVKCKGCKNKIERSEAFKIIKETSKGKTNEYYCNKKEYDSIQKEKEDKIKCYKVIKEIINVKMISPAWIKNINVVREFYDYSIIEKCFRENKDVILWSMQNKDFETEYAKSKYILTIILNNIEDTYKKHKKELQEMEKLFNKNENNEIDIDIMNNTIKNDTKTNSIIKPNKNKINDISSFLD